MKTADIISISENAQMIVCGYAFTQAEDGFIHIINLHAPHHALIINHAGETLETNMDDIEISIVMKYWKRNKRLLEEAYA